MRSVHIKVYICVQRCTDELSDTILQRIRLDEKSGIRHHCLHYLRNLAEFFL